MMKATKLLNYTIVLQEMYFFSIQMLCWREIASAELSTTLFFVELSPAQNFYSVSYTKLRLNENSLVVCSYHNRWVFYKYIFQFYTILNTKNKCIRIHKIIFVLISNICKRNGTKCLLN